MMKLKIISVNVSDKKGVIKKPIEKIILDMNGVCGDAHAGPWHRQVSILGFDSIKKFSQQLGREIQPGEFAENITLEGFDVMNCGFLDRFVYRNLILEVTQIGKKCHGTNCSIFRETGDCVMPKEGIFCRVIQGGELKKDDEFIFVPKIFKILVITLSDRCAAGLANDTSGPAIANKIKLLMEQNRRQYDIENCIIPDEPGQLKTIVKEAVNKGSDIIITTGSTGIGPRDIAPETLKPLFDKEIPGIMDFIRMKYGAEKPNALISRSIAGVINKTLVFTLPGSTKAVNEYMNEINKIIFHCFNMIYQIDNHS